MRMLRSVDWMTGLLRRRLVEVLVAALSIALAIGFIAALGTFAQTSRAALTARAAARVPVDWQVQVTPQGNVAAVRRQVSRLPDVTKVEEIAFARVPGLLSHDASGVRQTGAAYVVSIPPRYAATFPGELRHLLGANGGTQLFQQTAANLAARPGSDVVVQSGSGRKRLTVRGVLDMPAEDSFFQVVGLAPGSGASAPPDNVLLVPPSLFAATVGSRTVVHQFHVGFKRSTLPHDPQSAALAVQQRANAFQAAVSGGALVGDNLSTTLTAAGEDARYADLLFILLGFPGLALAAVVAVMVLLLRSDRRRREIALLRMRGATGSDVVGIVTAEALVTGVLGTLLGVPLAAAAVSLALPTGTVLSSGWTVAAVIIGLLLALVTQLASAGQWWRGAGSGIASDAGYTTPARTPWPLRAGLDVILLVGAAIAFALVAKNGYQVVLAPEGIPQTQVNYAALAGPALAWPGLALLVWRLTDMVTSRRTGRWARSRAGRAPELEAAALRRRRRVVARGAAGLAVALGLAVSTAIFTATYRTQARVDVALTVGSDVAVVEPPGAHVGPAPTSALASAPGVRRVEPLMHRFAYVGPDLQDLYGVRAATFAAATPLQDAFVPGSTIKRTMQQLQSTPDGVLLSAETLHDYQLHPGDLIRIRLQTARSRSYRPVSFHVLGQVAEWPTAPKDSFIVANAGYLARTTGSSSVDTFLVSTSTPTRTAAALRARLGNSGSGARVQDVGSATGSVTSASGLASTDLTGLSRLELGFGVLLALACSGLALFGGILERRRALVLLASLGATPRQRRSFLAVEARALVSSGVVGGAVIGAIVAYLLVKVLTGIFDPPPASATVPWAYLGALVALVVGVTVLVVSVAGRLVARAGSRALRDL